MSNNIIYQLRAAVINGAVTVRSISTNSTQNINSNLPNNNQVNSHTQITSTTTSTSTSTSNPVTVGSDPALSNANNPNLLTLNQSMLSLINFIQNQYSNLKLFQFQSVTPLNDSTYRLSYSFLHNPSLIYIIDAKFRMSQVSNSSNYQIISSKWATSLGSNYIDIGNPVNFYNDQFASLITSQMQQNLLTGLNISNAILVKV